MKTKLAPSPLGGVSPLLLYLAAVALLGLVANAFAHEVIVFSWLTEAGKTVRGPSPDHSVRFLLAGGRYRELGSGIAGEKSPPAERVDYLVRHALVVGGYRDGTAAFPDGDVVVLYYWGYMNLVRSYDGKGHEFILNESDLLRLVGAPAYGQSQMTLDRSDIVSAAREPRYFVVVAAYDFATYAAQRVRKLLWSTQMSVPLDGVSQVQAVPMMLAAGAALFGRETPRPIRIGINMARDLNPDLPER